MNHREPIEGGCLCGAIRYRVSAPFVWAGHCHCSLCRRASAAPVVTWFTVKAEDFTVTQGAPKDFRASTVATRQFCPNCGTQLTFQHDDKKAKTDVTAASLDEPTLAVPESHVWTDSRISWFEIGDDLPRHRQGST